MAGRNAVESAPGRDVERRDVEPGLPVHLGEGSAHVERLAVGRDRKGPDGAVDGGSEGRRHAGVDVVGEEVAARHQALPGVGTGRTGVGEAAAREHGVAGDRLSPDDARVDLHRGQRVGGHRGRRIALLDRRDPRNRFRGGRRRGRPQRSRHHQGRELPRRRRPCADSAARPRRRSSHSCAAPQFRAVFLDGRFPRIHVLTRCWRPVRSRRRRRADPRTLPIALTSHRRCRRSQ